MYSLIKASSYKQPVWASIKILVLITIFGFIYAKLQGQEKLMHVALANINQSISTEYSALGLVLLMMPLNWCLEAIKWRLLAKPLAELSFTKALEGVLTGLSLSFITPHGVGDYVGRIMQGDHPQRGRYVGPIMLGRVCQMLPTALFGLTGLFFLLQKWVFACLLGAIFIIAVILLVQMAKIKRDKWAIRRSSFYDKIGYYFGIVRSYTVATVSMVIGLSVARYLVFSLQFVIIIMLFIPGIDLVINFAGVSWVFLSKSVLPTFNFLSDLGVREFSAIYFFDRFGVDLVAVINASLTLWMINVLLPTIIGAPLALNMKLRAR